MKRQGEKESQRKIGHEKENGERKRKRVVFGHDRNERKYEGNIERKKGNVERRKGSRNVVKEWK